MQLDNHELLTLLGARRRGSVYTCPVHGGQSHTLSPIVDESGAAYFSCNAARCRFRGDAVGLIAHTLKCDTLAALKALMPGGRYQSCAIEAPTAAEVSAYVSRHDGQLRIQAYLSRCQMALRQTPDKVRLRSGISAGSLNLIPPDLGLTLPPQDTPDIIRRATRDLAGLVYPFTYSGDVTAVLVQDPTTVAGGVTVPVLRDDLGVFMEQAPPSRDVQIIAPTPRMASLLYGNCTVVDSRMPPIIATLGYPLPPTYSGVKCLILLGTTDHPLRLEDLLAVCETQSAVAGCKEGPMVQVWRSSKRSDNITGEDMARAIVRHTQYQSLPVAVADMLTQCATREQLQAAASALTEHPIHPAIKREIVRAAVGRNASEEVLQLLSRDNYTAPTALRLANGKPLRVTPEGLVGEFLTGDPRPLCNVLLTPTHRVSTYKGDNLLYLDVAVPGADVPPVSVALSEQISITAEHMRKVVMRAFGEAGASPYVAFYSVGGYGWPDVLSRLAANCATYREVRTLGADAGGTIHLPNVSIDAKGTRAQRQIFTLPKPVLALYNAIPHAATTGSAEPFKWLLRNCNNMYVAAFTHGLLFVLYSMLRGVTHGPDSAQARLLFVETEGGIWENVFAQLCAVFSNSPPPVLNTRGPLRALANYTALGTLPWLGRIPVLRGDKMSQVVSDSPVSVCARVDSATATLGVGAVNTTYVTPAVSTPESVGVIDGADIDQLRAAVPGMLLDFLARLDARKSYTAHDYPSLALYDALCEMLDIEPSIMMEQVIRRTFPSIGMNGLNTLFDILHRAVNMPAGETGLCVVNGACRPDTNFTAHGQHIFVMQDVVVVSKAVVDIINADAALPMRFAATLLDSELKEREMLTACPGHLTVDENRCWVLPRPVWDRYILRQAPLTRNTLPVSVIRLREKEMVAG